MGWIGLAAQDDCLSLITKLAAGGVRSGTGPIISPGITNPDHQFRRSTDLE